MSDAGTDMMAVLYRWRIKPGREVAFAAAWTDATRALLEAGSLGSRLHRGDDGWWYGYAQWPSAAARAAAFAAGIAPDAGGRMQAAIEESLPAIELTPIADFLRPMAAACGEA